MVDGYLVNKVIHKNAVGIEGMSYNYGIALWQRNLEM